MSEQPPQDPYGQNPGGQPPEGPPGGQPPHDPNQPPAQPPYGQPPAQPPYGQPPAQPPYGQQPPYATAGPEPGRRRYGQDPNQRLGSGPGPEPGLRPAAAELPGVRRRPGRDGRRTARPTRSATASASSRTTPARSCCSPWWRSAPASLISIIGSIVTGGDALFSYDSDGFQFSPLAGVFNILGQVAVTLFGAALIRGAFDAVDGREVTLGSMFERWDKIQVLVAALVDQRAHHHRLRAVRAARLRGHLPDLVRDVLHRRPGRGRGDRDQVELLVRLEARRAAAAAGAAVASCASWPARSPAWSACWWPTRW